jgi:surface antigen
MGTAFLRLAVVALCVGLAGCASGPDEADLDDSAPSYQSRPSGVLQCVPYAREHSGVSIYGDAYTWWDKAAGRFARTPTPSEGAVMVLNNYAGPNRGHVAVVHQVLNSRTITIDHANWLDDGTIFTDDPVRDVSDDNDWSQVRVFNPRTGAWGGRVYPVQGFIGPGPDAGPNPSTDPGTDPEDSRVADTSGAARRDPISTLLADDDQQGEQDGY